MFMESIVKVGIVDLWYRPEIDTFFLLSLFLDSLQTEIDLSEERGLSTNKIGNRVHIIPFHNFSFNILSVFGNMCKPHLVTVYIAI